MKFRSEPRSSARLLKLLAVVGMSTLTLKVSRFSQMDNSDDKDVGSLNRERALSIDSVFFRIRAEFHH